MAKTYSYTSGGRTITRDSTTNKIVSNTYKGGSSSSSSSSSTSTSNPFTTPSNPNPFAPGGQYSNNPQSSINNPTPSAGGGSSGGGSSGGGSSGGGSSNNNSSQLIAQPELLQSSMTNVTPSATTGMTMATVASQSYNPLTSNNINRGEVPIYNTQGQLVGVESQLFGQSVNINEYNRRVAVLENISTRYTGGANMPTYERQQTFGKDKTFVTTPYQVYVEENTSQPIENLPAYLKEKNVYIYDSGAEKPKTFQESMTALTSKTGDVETIRYYEETKPQGREITFKGLSLPEPIDAGAGYVKNIITGDYNFLVRGVGAGIGYTVAGGALLAGRALGIESAEKLRPYTEKLYDVGYGKEVSDKAGVLDRTKSYFALSDVGSAISTAAIIGTVGGLYSGAGKLAASSLGRQAVFVGGQTALISGSGLITTGYSKITENLIGEGSSILKQSARAGLFITGNVISRGALGKAYGYEITKQLVKAPTQTLVGLGKYALENPVELALIGVGEAGIGKYKGIRAEQLARRGEEITKFKESFKDTVKSKDYGILGKRDLALTPEQKFQQFAEGMEKYYGLEKAPSKIISGGRAFYEKITSPIKDISLTDKGLLGKYDYRGEAAKYYQKVVNEQLYKEFGAAGLGYSTKYGMLGKSAERGLFEGYQKGFKRISEARKLRNLIREQIVSDYLKEFETGMPKRRTSYDIFVEKLTGYQEGFKKIREARQRIKELRKEQVDLALEKLGPRVNYGKAIKGTGLLLEKLIRLKTERIKKPYTEAFSLIKELKSIKKGVRDYQINLALEGLPKRITYGKAIKDLSIATKSLIDLKLRKYRKTQDYDYLVGKEATNLFKAYESSFGISKPRTKFIELKNILGEGIGKVKQRSQLQRIKDIKKSFDEKLTPEENYAILAQNILLKEGKIKFKPLELKGRPSESIRTFYQATAEQNISGILREGLLPGKGKGVSMGKTDITKAVYTTAELERAIGYTGTIRQKLLLKGQRADTAILKIDLPESIYKKYLLEERKAIGGKEYLFKEIPKEYISLVRQEKIIPQSKEGITFEVTDKKALLSQEIKDLTSEQRTQLKEKLPPIIKEKYKRDLIDVRVDKESFDYNPQQTKGRQQLLLEEPKQQNKIKQETIKDLEKQEVKVFNIISEKEQLQLRNLLRVKQIRQERAKEKFFTDTRFTNLFASAEIGVEKSAQRDIELFAQPQSFAQPEAFAQPEILAEAQLLKQPLLFRQMERQQQRFKQPQVSKLLLELKLRDREPLLMMGKEKETRLRQAKAYALLIKRRGKYRQVRTDLTRGQALKLGSDISLTQLSRSFKIVETGKTKDVFGSDIDFMPSETAFRQYKVRSGRKIQLKDEFIQRVPTLLQTRGEKTAIAQARRNNKELNKLINFAI